MAISFSTEVKNARLQALCDAIDAKVTMLTLYNVSAEPLCTLTFPIPSKQSIENGALTFKSLTEAMVLATGEAINAAIVDIDSNVLATLTVGKTESSADLKLPSTLLFSGSLLRLNGWTITEL